MGRRGRRSGGVEDDDGLLIQALKAAWTSPWAGLILAALLLVVSVATHVMTPAASRPIGNAFVWLLVLVAAVLVAVAAAGTAWRRLGGPSRSEGVTTPIGRLPYRRRSDLLSRGELAFYGVLARAAGRGVTVFTKVRLGDLLDVPNGTPGWHQHHRRITHKHVDFVLCSGPRLTPFLVVELDDRTHARPDRAARDDFVDAALSQAGWPIEHVTAAAEYDVAELSARVGRHLPRPAPAGISARGRPT